MKQGKMVLIHTIFLLLLIDPFGNRLLAQKGDYPIQPVTFTAVTMEDNFWAPKIKTNHDVTIPYGFLKSANRLFNFEVAAGLKQGTFSSDFPFDDSDIYKLIEGASYSLHYYPDPKLERYIDSVITIIGKAQEPDGYLYTTRTIAEKTGTKPHEWSGDKRWVNEHILSHELYNLGHLFESAVAYYQATGKKNLLQIAIKAADRIDQDFGWGKIENYPGHQIVETGLARLYRATGDERYLNLAKFFLDVRGPGGEEYCQADKKVVDQTQAVGHSVRAVYMYAGMADIAALKNDPSYIRAIDKIWEDIVSTKTYVTGGIGASGGNEGFNGAYNLPNGSAYCETCASIGNVYLNQRLFLLHGDAKYIDVLERTLYNALLSGVSLSGNRFFYPNVLLSTGNQQRSEWFSCACCPPNVTRLIPSVPGYIYAINGDHLYVNLFAQNTARLTVNGNPVELKQKTGYPWDGDIEITVNPASKKTFTMMVRIPGWARNEAIPGNLYRFTDAPVPSYALQVNGKTVTPEVKNGYAVITRTWKKGDRISLSLPMNPREMTADPRVKADSLMIAIQRGPLVYCAEGADNGGKVLNLNFHPQEMPLKARFDPTLLGGTEVIETAATQPTSAQSRTVTLIPYFLWNNRGRSQMEVWLSARTPRPIPDSLVVIDETSGDKVETNYVSPWESLNSICDLNEPSNSADKGTGAFGNWKDDGGTIGKWNWVQYDLHEIKSIASSEVYWWVDGDGIALPDSAYLSYRDPVDGQFKVIPASFCTRENGTVAPGKNNRVHFPAVNTDNIRLNFKGQEKAQGILEWSVFTTGKTGK